MWLQNEQLVTMVNSTFSKGEHLNRMNTSKHQRTLYLTWGDRRTYWLTDGKCSSWYLFNTILRGIKPNFQLIIYKIKLFWYSIQDSQYKINFINPLRPWLLCTIYLKISDSTYLSQNQKITETQQLLIGFKNYSLFFNSYPLFFNNY